MDNQEDVVITISWSPNDPNPDSALRFFIINPKKPTPYQIYQALSIAERRVVTGMWRFTEKLLGSAEVIEPVMDINNVEQSEDIHD